jgi:AbrB family looped-hinge helix DNA binding protein
MKTTIDKAGRLVIPKSIRDALGLAAGTEVDIVMDGVAIRIDGPRPTEPELVEVNGRLVVKKTGQAFPVDVIGALREERVDHFDTHDGQ